MTELPPSPWIHIGECPVCVDGLCRVRTCVKDAAAHFYALCDECEALWIAPNTDSPRTFPGASQPQCPICQQDLYGAQAHWALADELRGTEWMANAIFEVANPGPPDSRSAAGWDEEDEPKPDC